MKPSNVKGSPGCGTMTAYEMTSQLGVDLEMDLYIEGLDDYYESDIRSFDQAQARCIFSE